MLGRRVIVYLGQLSHDRQSDFLLEVVKYVRESEPNVLLVLAGDAPSSEEQAWIRQRIRDLAVEDHVWLTGWLPQESVLPLGQSCGNRSIPDTERGAFRHFVAY